MIYYASGLFIISCFIYAFYSFYSIIDDHNSIEWHVCQWFSAVLFIASGYLIPRDLTWHSFGNMCAVAVFGIPVYILTLRALQKWFR